MRILLWGNSFGIQATLDAIGPGDIVGVVAASNRPDDTRTVQSIAANLGLPCLVQPRHSLKKSCARFVSQLRNLRADLFLVNAYSMLLRPQILALPRLGAFNVHVALLPQYRGANVVNWVLINGESESGVTIHKMNESIDSGNIVGQQRVAIELTDTAVTLRSKLLTVAANLVRDTLAQIDRGAIEERPQDESKARYWPPRKPEDGLIDWNWPVLRIYNLIRALVAPWPGAYFFDRSGQKIVLNRFLTIEQVTALQKELRLT